MRKLVLFLVMLFMGLQLMAQRPKVGVVLCGGGAKGAAHVGVLKVLEENNIPIDFIAGTSMGAIVGGLYSIGYSAADLDSLIMNENWTSTMSDRLPERNVTFESKRFSEKYILDIPFGRRPPRGRMPHNTEGEPRRGKPSILGSIPMALIGGQNIYNLFTKLSVGYQDSLDFNNMPIPFACVAVDLISKKEVVFRSGRFVDAIRASMAIPGVFAPVRMNGMVLIDGGVTNTFPVDVVKEMGADIVIGIYLDDSQDEVYVNSIGDMFNELLNLYMNEKLPEAFKNTNILIAPKVKDYGTMSFDTLSLRNLMDIGAATAYEHQEDLRRLKHYLDQKQAEEDETLIGPKPKKEKYNKAVHIDRDSVTIRSVSFSGVSANTAERLLRGSKLKPGARLSGQDIQEAIDDFYSTSAFSSVTYALKGKENPFDMDLHFVPGYTSQVGVGFRFDTEEVAKILLNASINNRSLYGSKYSIEGELAYNPKAKVQYSYAFRSLAQFNVSYDFQRTDMDLFDYIKHTIDVGVSSNKFKYAQTRAGARFDSFNIENSVSMDAIPNEYNKDAGRKNYLSVYGEVILDQRDKVYFPTRGMCLSAGYSYYFNLLSQSAESPFSVTNLSFTGVVPISKHLALIPSISTRFVLGDNIPMGYMNTMGGYQAGRYLSGQIPFVGFNSIYAFDKILATASVDARVRFLRKHYITASAAYAQDCYDLNSFFLKEGIFAARLGYAFDTVIGPVAANFHWSNYTKNVGFFMSFGYSF